MVRGTNRAVILLREGGSFGNRLHGRPLILQQENRDMAKKTKEPKRRTNVGKFRVGSSAEARFVYLFYDERPAFVLTLEEAALLGTILIEHATKPLGEVPAPKAK